MFVFYVIYIVFLCYTICALSQDKYNGMEWKSKAKQNLGLMLKKRPKILVSY